MLSALRRLTVNFTKMNQVFLILAFLAISLMISGVVFAAGQSSTNYIIESDVVSGGGGESSSTNYTAEHTTGQPTIGESSSTNYSNYAGFWHAAIGAPAPDTDGDLVPDNIDNCYLTPNPGQQDTNDDGYGNACDCDINNDGVVSIIDYNAFRNAWGLNSSSPTWNPDIDFNSDGVITIVDYNTFRNRWNTSQPFY